MAHPEYGAKYCKGAASEAVALTIIVYFKASEIKSPSKGALHFAVWTGLEPATSCVTGRHSNQLNYQTFFNRGAKIALHSFYAKK